jgi:hypothetical protein
MPKPFQKWTVLPHSNITRLDDNLFSVTGDLHMPVGDVPRRMTVVRLHDARLLIYSAIALYEPEMRMLEALGEPTYLVVPNDIHRMDAKIWRDRYPNLIVIAPAGVKKKVEEVVEVQQTTGDFIDPNVQCITVPGTLEREIALVVSSESGTTLVVNDLIWNLGDRPGFGGWLLHAMGFTGKEPRIPAIVGLRAVKNKRALRSQLVAWSKLSRLNRIVVSHGDIVTSDPPAVLRSLASELAA